MAPCWSDTRMYVVGKHKLHFTSSAKRKQAMQRNIWHQPASNRAASVTQNQAHLHPSQREQRDDALTQDMRRGWMSWLVESSPVCAVVVVMMENIEELSPLRITPTVRALSSALRGKREDVHGSSRVNGDRVFPEPEKLWFKESSAKNLRNRDFLSPTTMLNTLYADGQVGLTDTCWIY